MFPAHSAEPGLLVKTSLAREVKPPFTVARPTRLESLFDSRFAERIVDIPTAAGPATKPVARDIHGQGRQFLSSQGQVQSHDLALARHLEPCLVAGGPQQQKIHFQERPAFRTLFASKQYASRADVLRPGFFPAGLARYPIAKGGMDWEAP
jgi:hypothetical protein